MTCTVVETVLNWNGPKVVVVPPASVPCSFQSIVAFVGKVFAGAVMLSAVPEFVIWFQLLAVDFFHISFALLCG